MSIQRFNSDLLLVGGDIETFLKVILVNLGPAFSDLVLINETLNFILIFLLLVLRWEQKACSDLALDAVAIYPISSTTSYIGIQLASCPSKMDNRPGFLGWSSCHTSFFMQHSNRICPCLLSFQDQHLHSSLFSKRFSKAEAESECHWSQSSSRKH